MGMALRILFFAYSQNRRKHTWFDVDLSMYTAKAWLYI